MEILRFPGLGWEIPISRVAVSIGSLEGIDTVVSDCEFPEAFTSRFPRTEFRFVTPCKE